MTSISVEVFQPFIINFRLLSLTSRSLLNAPTTERRRVQRGAKQVFANAVNQKSEAIHQDNKLRGFGVI